MKFLQVEMPDGSFWRVPARLIAENRADHYGDEDGHVKGDQHWLDEVTYALDDDFELRDWAANNMNWSDVESAAVRVEQPPKPIDFQEGWCNGRKWVIALPD